jgi:hypothetical protein
MEDEMDDGFISRREDDAAKGAPNSDSARRS